MAMHVISPGPRTTIQDKGRLGFQNSGFAPSGFMDRVASRMANVLVGNEDSEAVVEFCLIGPVLQFDETVNLAVCGGDFGIDVGYRHYPANRAVRVPAGIPVKITTGRSGTYGSLAVGGGLDIPLVMGSRSTNLRCGIGGFKGRALMAGDTIELRDPENGKKDLSWRWVPGRRLISPEDPDVTMIRVIPGPQDDMFTEEGIMTFYSSTYVITASSDRMGYRLAGPEIEHVKDGNIIAKNHNRVIEKNDPTCHGEMEAIRTASQITDSCDLSGCELYTTGEPCPMCLFACLWAKIDKVYYGCTIEDNSAIGFRDKQFHDIGDGREKLNDYLTCTDREACLDLFYKYSRSEHTLY